MSVTVHDDTRNATTDATTARADGGTLTIYGGTRPASANDSPGAASALAVFDLDDPAYSASVEGEASLNGAPNETIAAAAGTAAWYRVSTSSGGTVFDGNCGLSNGGGTSLVLNTLQIEVDVPVTLLSGAYRSPAGSIS